MPNLQEAVNADLSGYTPVDTTRPVNAPTPSVDMQPGRSPMMRCPLPLLSSASPDALRSFYLNGKVPQVRLLTPQATVPATTAAASTATVVAGSSSSSGSTTVTPSLGTAQATITSATIGPNAQYTGVMSVSKVFQLLSLAVNSPARVRMYGTATAQSSDLARGLDVAPAAGTGQNIICDVVLDTVPYQWTFQSRVGANADATQTAAIYITITNLDATSDAISATLVYVPLVS